MLGVGIRLIPQAWSGEAETKPSSAEGDLLTQAKQVIQLTPAQAAEHHPVRLRGVVTCLETRSSLFFIQDSTAGIYVYDPNPPAALKRGHLIEVQGLSSSGLYVPVVTATNILMMGEGPLPTAKPITAQALASGAEDSQWVEMEAIVRKEGEDWGHWLIEAASGEHRFLARILEMPPAPRSPFVDARLRLRGVAAAHYNSHRQRTGFHLIVPGLSDLTVLTPPPKDPFALPLHLGTELQAYTPEAIYGHRIRVQGVVLLFQPGKRLFLKDSTGGLRVETALTNHIIAGDIVDVAGFPMPGTSAPRLENAIYRKTGTVAPPQPSPLLSEAIPLEKFESQLIEIEGHLLDQDQVSEDHQVLLIQRGKRKQLISCLLPLPSMGGRSFFEPRGSTVRLTGVATQVAGPDEKAPRFQLWLRTPSDVRVLRRPYFWTLNRVLAGLGAGGLLLLIVFAWTRVMHQRMQQQTALLRMKEQVLEERSRSEHQLRQFIAERARLGRDLHDGIIQSIYGVGLGIEDCCQLLKDQPKLAEDRLKRSLAALNGVIREVRQFIGELEPETAQSPKLSIALQHLAASMESSQGARIHWNIDSQAADKFNSIQASQVMHIVREGLSNSLRHAQAESVRIFLGPEGSGARIEVEDQGIGFDVQHLDHKGHGLRNMAARALEMGATLKVDSQPGRGTKITLIMSQVEDHEQRRTETNSINAGG